jgi:hypothetical protein
MPQSVNRPRSLPTRRRRRAPSMTSEGDASIAGNSASRSSVAGRGSVAARSTLEFVRREDDQAVLAFSFFASTLSIDG